MKIGALIAPFGPARGILAETYSRAYEKFSSEEFPLDLRIDNMMSADQTDSDPDPQFMRWLQTDAAAVLVQIPPAYGAIFTQLQELHQKTGKPVIPLSPECAAVAGNVDRHRFKTLWAYQQNGGLENICNLLRFCAHITGFSPQSAPPPIEMPLCGIHHPDAPVAFDSLAAYRQWRPPVKGAYTVGLFFPRAYWIDGSLAVFDALISELEANGVNVIAVFNDKFKTGGDEAALEKFFTRNNEVIVDAVLLQAYFFLRPKRKAISEFRWTPLSEIIQRGGAADFVDLEAYGAWLEELPRESRTKLFDGWGNPFEGHPADLGDLERMSLALHNGRIIISGLMLGNVFVGLQPKRGCAGARCDGSVCKILHDPLVPPHQYLAFYKWIEKVFRADAMVHVGTHGNIELLPGKSVALSPACFSHFAVGALPHFYIYVVSNPMEGAIAKRRGLAVIVDHLHPVMDAVKLYGALEELEAPLEEYVRARAANERGRLKELEKIIRRAASKAAVSKGPEQFHTFDLFTEYLHGQMSLLTETQFRDGLHTLGAPPEGERRIAMLASILRFDQGRVPSLRRWIIQALGLNWDEVLENPEQMAVGLDCTHTKVLALADGVAKEIIRGALNPPVDSDDALFDLAAAAVQHCFGVAVSGAKEQLVQIVRFGIGLVPAIDATIDEMDNLIRGFNGEFIEPGASGALARGKVETLPTGRNYYSIDPNKIPTPAAWNVGVRLAETFFHKYLHEHEAYPETIGFVFRFFDIFRADGEQLAQMLYTLGVKPVWKESRITGLEVISQEELQGPGWTSPCSFPTCSGTDARAPLNWWTRPCNWWRSWTSRRNPILSASMFANDCKRSLPIWIADRRCAGPPSGYLRPPRAFTTTAPIRRWRHRPGKRKRIWPRSLWIPATTLTARAVSAWPPKKNLRPI